MLQIYKDSTELLTGLADFVVDKAKAAIARNGRFNFALSGGSSPKKLYELLTTEAYRSKIEWAKVYFFFGDERYVPLDHPDSNYLMSKKALFDPLSIPAANIFPIDTSLSPQKSAKAYEAAMKKHFNGPCTFDVILLGLGDNSHTASLFPHTTILYEEVALVKEIYVEEVKMNRITFTAPLINMAQSIAFLVYGIGKADAVHHILEDSRNIEQYPAQLIRPHAGLLFWFLDEAAASKISH